MTPASLSQVGFSLEAEVVGEHIVNTDDLLEHAFFQGVHRKDGVKGAARRLAVIGAPVPVTVHHAV